MRAVVLTGIRQMELVDLPEPAITRDKEVLLKVELVGVCGSDVHYYQMGRIGSQVVEYPFIVGHECVATIKAVGKAVTSLKVGDLVVVDPAVPCYECDQCAAGRENTCRNLRFLGTPGQGSGCLCEYIVMPEQSCLAVNEQISPEQGVLCEPFTIGVYAVKQAQMPRDANIAVLGCGPIGLSCLVAAQAQGAKDIYATDRVQNRALAAVEAGAVFSSNPDREDVVKQILSRRPEGIDTVFECAGQQNTLDEAVELLKPGGKLVIIGIPRCERISFIIDRIRRKEITIVNVRRQRRCTRKAIDLIAGGRAKVDFMVTHRFGLEQVQEAFDMVAGYHDGVIKALIEI